MQLITDRAFCDVPLRNACLGIAIFYVVTIVLGVIARPSYLGSSTTIVGFVAELIGNIALLFGALWNNHWLVLVWLVTSLLFFIGWPIAICGVIFNFGYYRAQAFFDNVFLILLEYIIYLLIMVYLLRIVYSFYHQLRNSKETPQHAVVV